LRIFRRPNSDSISFCNLELCLQFFLITNSASIATFAVSSGIDRIMVDLEKLGKIERQGHIDSVMSDHNISDISAIRSAAPDAEILVRTNPLNPGSAIEVNDVINAGADILMLPMFNTPEEVTEFSRLVASRVPIMLLAETTAAKDNLAACASVKGVQEVHIGLNDLSLQMGKRFMFELLVDGTVDRMADILRGLKIPFGIGGVARAGEGLLPAEHILIEHVRLGSTAAILSRTFHRNMHSVAQMKNEMDFPMEIGKLRTAYANAQALGPTEFATNREQVCNAINHIRAALPDRHPSI
jgi:hypothetical protein